MFGREKSRAKLGPLDPVATQIAEFYKTDPLWQGLRTRPAAETRAAMRAAAPPGEKREVEHVEDFRVHVTHGTIGLRFYRPVAKPHAVIVWAHGGGFTFGSVEESDGFVRALALETGCAIASVDYRLAPEFPFPFPVNDLLSAALWVSDRRVSLTGTTAPLMLGGDSAGANLAIAVTRRLHENRICPVAGNILAYPCTADAEIDSLRDFDPPFLTVKDIEWFYDQYVPKRADRRSADFAPLRAKDFKLMPPSLILTAEHDVITGQAEEYGRKLAAAGVDVRMKTYPGMIHGFLTLEPFFTGPAGAAMREIAAFTVEAAAGAKSNL